jgi:hypothetical protein
VIGFIRFGISHETRLPTQPKVTYGAVAPGKIGRGFKAVSVNPSFNQLATLQPVFAN